MEREEDWARLLPDDVLAEVLRRVPPRWLAASRCVCRAWRALVDDRHLLRAELLPRKLAGFFLCFSFLDYPEFFARSSASLADYHTPDLRVDDHCNGLLLLEHDRVLNPATGGYARLPPRPPERAAMQGFSHDPYLVFDPTVSSSRYDVFLVPKICSAQLKDSPETAQLEWPPSPHVLTVFSSTTWQWEERPFVREGDAAGTIADIQPDPHFRFHRTLRHAAYWRGALYVHCQNNFVMRISLSEDTYKVIKPPSGITDISKQRKFHLGRSLEGVYCALLQTKYGQRPRRHLWLSVWLLDESFNQMEWILKHDSDIGLAFTDVIFDKKFYGPWILENANYYYDDSDNNNVLAEQEFEWNSDDENILHTEDSVGRFGYFNILGFHPFKEIVFLVKTNKIGLAYHLKSSKLEVLGNLYPKGYTLTDQDDDNCEYMEDALPYTPCMIGEFPTNVADISEDEDEFE
ncbi:hypothetical protein ACP4OV_020918 [Aristida adscensionis]